MAVAVHRSNYLAFWVILIFTSWTMGSHLSLVWLDSQFPEVRPDTHCSSCPLTRVFPRNLTKDTLSTVVPLLYWDRVVSNTTQLATKIQLKCNWNSKTQWTQWLHCYIGTDRSTRLRLSGSSFTVYHPGYQLIIHTATNNSQNLSHRALKGHQVLLCIFRL